VVRGVTLPFVAVADMVAVIVATESTPSVELETIDASYLSDHSSKVPLISL
jgi:hypothetical protein